MDQVMASLDAVVLSPAVFITAPAPILTDRLATGHVNSDARALFYRQAANHKR